MDLIQVLWESLASILVLFILTKIMGQRQMSQMSMFDYICGISIGSIAAEAATAVDNEVPGYLLAMIIFALVTVAISFFTCKSLKMREFVNGKPIILYENNKIYEKNLLTAKVDINEFLTQCRTQGYFDLNDIETAILETNGQLSILPKAEQKPLTPEDMQLTVSPDKPAVNVILDGRVLAGNLKTTGNDDVWLKRQLEMQKINRVEDIFLAFCDADNQLTIFEKTNKKMRREIFE